MPTDNPTSPEPYVSRPNEIAVTGPAVGFPPVAPAFARATVTHFNVGNNMTLEIDALDANGNVIPGAITTETIDISGNTALSALIPALVGQAVTQAGLTPVTS